MQNPCPASRSRLVHACQSWKGPGRSGGLSQFLASQVIAPGLGGAGARGRARTSPQDPGLLVLGSLAPHCTTSMWLAVCPCVWECRAVPGWEGIYVALIVLAQS